MKYNVQEIIDDLEDKIESTVSFYESELNADYVYVTLELINNKYKTHMSLKGFGSYSGICSHELITMANYDSSDFRDIAIEMVDYALSQLD